MKTNAVIKRQSSFVHLQIKLQTTFSNEDSVATSGDAGDKNIVLLDFLAYYCDITHLLHDHFTKEQQNVCILLILQGQLFLSLQSNQVRMAEAFFTPMSCPLSTLAPADLSA